MGSRGAVEAGARRAVPGASLEGRSARGRQAGGGGGSEGADGAPWHEESISVIGHEGGKSSGTDDEGLHHDSSPMQMWPVCCLS